MKPRVGVVVGMGCESQRALERASIVLRWSRYCLLNRSTRVSQLKIREEQRMGAKGSSSSQPAP